MTLSSLLMLLEQGALIQIRTAIAKPLVAFRRGLAERGRSAPVELNTVGQSSAVKAAHIVVLLNAHANDSLSKIELRYLANAIGLSPDASFDSNAVRDVISQLSDNDAIDVEQVLKELRSGAAA